MRKSPIRHPVKSHIRKGKQIDSYERGRGRVYQKPSKVVGKQVYRDIVNEVWNKLMSVEPTSIPLRFVHPDSSVGMEYRSKEGAVFAVHDPYRFQISIVTYPGWEKLTEDEMAHILSHELIEVKSVERMFQHKHDIKDEYVRSPLWHVSRKFDEVQLKVLREAGYDWTKKKFDEVQTTSVVKMYGN